MKAVGDCAKTRTDCGFLLFCDQLSLLSILLWLVPRLPVCPLGSDLLHRKPDRLFYLWWGQRPRWGVLPTHFWTALDTRVPLRLPLALISFLPQLGPWTTTLQVDWSREDTGCSSRSTSCPRRGCPGAWRTSVIWRGFWGGDSSTAGRAFTWRSILMAPYRGPERTTVDSVRDTHYYY